MEPLKIQLAIQGGGAKIVALFAVLEAVEDLQDNNIVHVTRIAGTSAGAIAGCLFAAGLRMPLLCERLKAVSPEQIRRAFPSPSKLRVVCTLGRGVPIWDTQPLEKFLEELFERQGVHYLEDLEKNTGIEVFVVAANLNDTVKEVYRGHVSIVRALLDSSGIPYFFRTWRNGGSSVIVDGGVCENLPYEELLDNVRTYGPVVGISFKRSSRARIRNLADFSHTLLDAAIENSMELARRRIGPASVHVIDTDLQTFDFVRARSEGLGAKYQLTKIQAQEFFTDFVRRQRESRIADGQVDIMRNLAAVYEAHGALSKFAYRRCSIIAQARCLLESGEEGFGHPDFVHYEAEFETLDEPIYCHKIIVSNAKPAATLEHTQWSVVNMTTGESIHTIHFPINKREMLLFFTPNLPPRTGPYLFDFQDLVDGFFAQLRARGRDEYRFLPLRADGPIEQINLVLWVPSRLQDTRMVPKPGIGGRRMLPHELTGKYAPPPNYHALGWTGRNVPSDRAFAVDVCL
jgi:predicted acylesterase/phospholipase RssA